MKSILETINETRVDDMKIKYIIKACNCIYAEDNYTNGELTSNTVIYRTEIGPQSSLINLMKNFVKRELDNHKFDISEWSYDPEFSNRLELSVIGRSTGNRYFFEEPTPQEWDDFKTGKINLTSFVFQFEIEKHEVVTNLIDEFKKLKIESM